MKRYIACASRHALETSSDPLLFKDIRRIRNIGIIAHIDAGKTTTSERMLFYAGMTSHMGNVDEGDTVLDYLPQEKARGITIKAAAITFAWETHRLNLIDTPGHVDFTIEVERSLRVLDGAVVILDAVSGVQTQTMTVWKQANRYHVPRLVFLNKMDRPNADMGHCMAQLRSQFSEHPLAVQLPLFGNKNTVTACGLSAHDAMRHVSTPLMFQGVVDLVRQKTLRWDLHDGSKGTCYRVNDLMAEPSHVIERALEARSLLLDQLAILDEKFGDDFLSLSKPLEQVCEHRVTAAIRGLVQRRCGLPVLCGAAFRNQAVQPLLDAIVAYLPSPIDRAVSVHLADGAYTTLEAREDGPLAVLVFKVLHDPQRGDLVFVRVYSGTLEAKRPLWNATRSVRERPTKLLQIYADDSEEIPRIAAGNIGVVLGLSQTITGDTLVAEPTANFIMEQSLAIPSPVFYCAIEPITKADEKPLEQALIALQKEDPTVRVHADINTQQLLLGGMGELHLEILRERLATVYKTHFHTGKIRIAYRESLLSTCHPVESTIWLDHLTSLTFELRPHIDPSENHVTCALTFPDEQLLEGGGGIAAIRQAILTRLERGILAGFPLVGLHVCLKRVYFNNGRTTLLAIRMGAADAIDTLFREHPLLRAALQLLEPVMRLEIQVSETYLGAVLMDVASRHGRILATRTAELSQGEMVISAELPLAATLGYATELRTKTAGTASFTMQVSHYSPVSAGRQRELLREMGFFIPENSNNLV
jgi:elongation factor G